MLTHASVVRPTADLTARWTRPEPCDDRLYELVDEDGEVISVVTLDGLASAWEAQA
jgi:hypothetical protein